MTEYLEDFINDKIDKCEGALLFHFIGNQNDIIVCRCDSPTDYAHDGIFEVNENCILLKNVSYVEKVK